jgi:hypothetical protein
MPAPDRRAPGQCVVGWNRIMAPGCIGRVLRVRVASQLAYSLKGASRDCGRGPWAARWSPRQAGDRR